MYLKLIKIAWLVFLAGVLFAATWFYAVSVDMGGLFGGMPPLKELENPKTEQASELYSADGVLLGKYFYENRTPVAYEDISENVLNALVATEDVRFEDHSGIDLISITRAVVGVLTFNRKGGGSTLTQQLAKNLFDTRSDAEYRGSLNQSGGILHLLITKSKEWVLALQIERNYTKKEIITMYLNTVDFGMNSFGLNVAAKKYFNKHPRDLEVEEAAVLVGMLKAPTKYNPILNPKNAEYRRNTVIGQMRKYEYINSTQYDSLTAKAIITNSDIRNVDDHNQGLAPYFRKVIKNKLTNWCKERGYDLFADGLKIYTTVDSRMQRYAEEASREHMQEIQKIFFEQWEGRDPWIDEHYREIKGFLEMSMKRTPHYRALRKAHAGDSVKIWTALHEKKKIQVFDWNAPNFEKDTVLSPMDSLRYYKHFLRMGMMAMEPQTGHIKAWVGGIDHRYFKYDHVQQGKRQPGSTFKAMVYAAAINERGFHPCFTVEDVPITFQLPTGQTWTAENSDGYSFEPYSLRRAMARSINTVAAYITREVKPSTIRKYAGTFGLDTTNMEPVPSICLGTADVSVYELTGAYATFANKGIWTEPVMITRIEDKNGKVIQEFPARTREVLNPDAAYTMLHMLMGPTEERGGTALGLWRYKFRRELGTGGIAGKTGTTSNNSDAWFMGLTKNLAVGTWCGGDDRAIHFRSTRYGQGAKQAMPAYAKFAEKVYGDEELLKELGYTKEKFVKPEGYDVELNCGEFNKVQQMPTSPTAMPDDPDIF